MGPVECIGSSWHVHASRLLVNADPGLSVHLPVFGQEDDESVAYDWAESEVGPEDNTQNEVECEHGKEVTKDTDKVKDVELLLCSTRLEA